MQKSAAAFRTISEVGEALEVPAHVLRFWESKFSQIKPVKRGGGRRYYRPEDVGLIRGIQHLLYEQGMTIKGAQKVLSERGVKSVTEMGTGLLEIGRTAEKPQPAPAEPAHAAEAPTHSNGVDTLEKPSKQELKQLRRQLRHLRRRARQHIKSIN